MALFTIRLEELRLHGFHGVMPQENRVGAEFGVDVELVVDIADPGKDKLEDTISYADVYDIVKRRMKEPRKLLETVAWEIGRDIRAAYSRVQRGRVKITKLSPPISGILGVASVEAEI